MVPQKFSSKLDNDTSKELPVKQFTSYFILCLKKVPLSHNISHYGTPDNMICGCGVEQDYVHHKLLSLPETKQTLWDTLWD